jgi:hypothetical protein
MKLEIVVTKEIIRDHGENVLDNYDCPVAVATKAALVKARVKTKFPFKVCYYSTIWIGGKMYNLPKTAQDLQAKLFDGEKAKPISFTLELA